MLRDAGQYGKLVTILKAQIEKRVVATVLLMPAGQVNQLASRQQFLDLVKYLIEIRDGGSARALELKPDSTLMAAWSVRRINPPELYFAHPLQPQEWLGQNLYAAVGIPGSENWELFSSRCSAKIRVPANAWRLFQLLA